MNTTPQPILFTSMMMRQLRDDKKTVTRRRMKPQPVEMPGERITSYRWECSKLPAGYVHTTKEILQRIGAQHAFYQPGMVCYCKESYRLPREYDFTLPTDAPEGIAVWYDADGSAPGQFGRSRPARHMCKWMCREWLRITHVGCEPVQEITTEEILAEGVDIDLICKEYRVPACDVPTLQAAWWILWEAIHGEGAKDRNEWVYPVRFERIEKPEGA